ncbi:MAG: hypothetical protein DRP59_06075 [Spirochaetes bacterium]|nr:MAG: hypothetical protein DRP59_06075 [Spirochaetota bacterium]
MISWHKKPQLTEEQEEFLEADFVEVFTTPIGQRVLGKILTDLHFFSRCEGEEEVALNNYAKQLLSYFGEWDVGSEELIINRLMRRDNVT